MSSGLLPESYETRSDKAAGVSSAANIIAVNDVCEMMTTPLAILTIRGYVMGVSEHDNAIGRIGGSRPRHARDVEWFASESQA